MGTRADFYVGRDKSAEWLGSSAWDGYPDGMSPEMLAATTEDAFRAEVTKRISEDDGTRPEEGWPWPWEDSCTTDYAYAFDDGKVWACCFGRGWFDPLKPEPDEDDEDRPPTGDGKPVDFPDMTEIQKVKLGKGSGLMIFTSKEASK